jgi:hypothetical protein
MEVPLQVEVSRLKLQLNLNDQPPVRYGDGGIRRSLILVDGNHDARRRLSFGPLSQHKPLLLALDGSRARADIALCGGCMAMGRDTRGLKRSLFYDCFDESWGRGKSVKAGIAKASSLHGASL